VIRTQEEHLAHYGILRRSGRYPWGSGGSVTTRNRSFLDTINIHRQQGMSDADIARNYGMTTTEFRGLRANARARQKQTDILTAQRLKDKGWSNVAIGQRMGINESSVRALLAPGAKDRVDSLQVVSNMLKDQVKEKGMVDVGKGVESQLGITQNKLNTAVASLKEEGYVVHPIKIRQLGTSGDNFTTMKVLAPPGTPLSYVQKFRERVRQIIEYSEDYGKSFLRTEPPISVSSRRVKINYKEDGGDKTDGVIFVRPGVKDLSLGGKNYGQVRIMVDNTHYLKGMAVYKDDLPDGIDLAFNTNKSRTSRKKDAMKPIETKDPNNPFGAIVRQVHGPDGKVTSALNIVGSPTKPESGVEGNWDTWSKTLSSQMLSKQDPKLAQQQLDLTFERRRIELEEISKLTNPTVRKDLLLKFADQTDSAAVHLKAAALPRQANRVLLPVSSMKPNEIYAPSFRNGERVVLIRHPHGGTFEIPELTVNNKNPEARKLLPPSPDMDAVGIHDSVAERLSGADFDGDTVLVIPNNRGSVKRTPALEDLKGFNPHVYKIPDDSPIPRITASRKGYEMGNVSNLITDMSLHGADTEELARAVKHSMVVIDSEKHGLDYRQSEKDHGIRGLKEKYQGGKRGGASTLISKATSPVHVVERKPRPAAQGGAIDPVTGKKVFVPTGRMKTTKSGRTELARIESKRLAETEDAFTLSSGTRMEAVYARHSNKLKAMANTARKDALTIKPNRYSDSAKKVYSKEVSSLNAKLNLAEKNAPRERQAQLVANEILAIKRQAHPGMDSAEIKKIKQQALNEARIRTGARKDPVTLTQSEWDAIQAGAISTHKLQRILNHADPDMVKKLAMPKTKPKMTATKIARAQSMLAAGYTQAEVAAHLGVGLTTLKEGISDG
jgi:hypothetical protein